MKEEIPLHFRGIWLERNNKIFRGWRGLWRNFGPWLGLTSRVGCLYPRDLSCWIGVWFGSF